MDSQPSRLGRRPRNHVPGECEFPVLQQEAIINAALTDRPGLAADTEPGVTTRNGNGDRSFARSDSPCESRPSPVIWLFGQLSVNIDPQVNATSLSVLHASDSAVHVLIIPADEERMIADHVRQVPGLR
jgi:hypothetical protein